MSKISIERKPESIVAAIMFAEFVLQENFLEYRDLFADSSYLMKFALENNYIDSKQYSDWKKDFENNEPGSQENFEVIFGDSSYCISQPKDDEMHAEEYEEALKVYGELIASNELYYEDFLVELHELALDNSNLEIEVLDIVKSKDELIEENFDLKKRVSILENLLYDCLSTMDDIHGYNYDSYVNASDYLHGEED